MMELLRSWLIGITCASMIVALADSLTPGGTVKKLGRLTGGLVLLVAILQPLVGLDYGTLSVVLADHRGEYDMRAADGTNLSVDFMKTIIEDRSRAYILDKAAQLGADCEVSVTCQIGEENLPYPAQAVITGALTEAQRQTLTRQIEAELAIPAAQQIYKDVTEP